MGKSIYTMSFFVLIILILSPIKSQNIYAQTDIHTGDVSGIWTKINSPYHINGEITIPNDSTLTIEPGVEVIFTGHYKFNVQGRLLAIGTETDTILFTINDTTGFHNVNIPDGGWSGIRFMHTPPTNDSSKIVYCRLQYGKANTGVGEDYDMLGGAICAVINKLFVSHCLFWNNTCYHPDIMLTAGGGIFIEGNPTIEFCEFVGNTGAFGGAICIWGSNIHPLIRNNYFHHNGGHGTIDIGSMNGSNTSPVLINNIFANNHSTGHRTQPNGHGIVHFSNGGGKAILINNTIVNNISDGLGGGLSTNYSTATPLLINNIIYGNTPAQVQLGVPSSLDFYNCLIEGGKEGFTGAAFTGTYENCLDTDPLFVSSNEYNLRNASPCIGAGIDSIQIGTQWYYSPSTDFEGNPRPNPLGSFPDIGAYENPLANPAHTEIPAGDVSGTWTKANSPYHINGEIKVPNGSTLTIEPGVEVVFSGHYIFFVKGRLLAIGTAQDSITFTAADPDTGWQGMKLFDIATSNDSTIFEYCSFQYGKTDNGGAICSKTDKLRISHCLFRNNVCLDVHPFAGTGGAIYIADSKPIIEYSEFCSNEAEFKGSALYIVSSDAIIRNNHFHHNIISTTIETNNSAPIIINNLIEHNHSNDEGILLFRNESRIATIVNNTIVNNTCAQGAILSLYGLTSFINNIIYENEPSQVYLRTSSNNSFYNCLIEGGKEGFTGAAFTGAYENCIDSDPLFKDEAKGDYHLSDASPCIGAGYYEEGLTPTCDCEGNLRPVGSSPDIGAYENSLNNPTDVEEDENQLRTKFALYQNYPNPFNPLTTIKYSIPAIGKSQKAEGRNVILKIYDILGREVATLVKGKQKPGNYEITWNAREYPSGVYFYQLTAGEFTETKKLILIK